MPQASAGLHSLLYGRVSLCTVVFSFGCERDNDTFKAMTSKHPYNSHGVRKLPSSSNQSYKTKVADKTRIRLKVLKWGDGGSCHFGERQANGGPKNPLRVAAAPDMICLVSQRHMEAFAVIKADVAVCFTPEVQAELR